MGVSKSLIFLLGIATLAIIAEGFNMNKMSPGKMYSRQRRHADDEEVDKRVPPSSRGSIVQRAINWDVDAEKRMPPGARGSRIAKREPDNIDDDLLEEDSRERRAWWDFAWSKRVPPSARGQISIMQKRGLFNRGQQRFELSSPNHKHSGLVQNGWLGSAAFADSEEMLDGEEKRFMDANGLIGAYEHASYANGDDALHGMHDAEKRFPGGRGRFTAVQKRAPGGRQRFNAAQKRAPGARTRFFA